MNVLPVLADLLSPKADLPSHGIGSSAGDFAHILDQTLSRPGGMPTPEVPAASSSSPSSPSPRELQQREHAASHHETQGSRANEMSRPSSHSETHATAGSNPRRSESHPASGHDSSHGKKGAAKGTESATGAADHSKAKAAAAENHKHDSKTATAAAADKSASTKTTDVHLKEKSHPAAAATTAVPFPGALVLAGAHKGATPSGKAGDAKPGKHTARLGAATKLLKGLHPDAQAKQAAPGGAAKPAKATGAAAAKKAPSKDAKQKRPTSAPQLLATLPATTSNTAASPQNLGAAVHSGAAHPSVQQDPNAAAGHSTPTNQAAGVTIIDLRQHDQNSGSSTGQKGGQSHSNEGGNVRLFQLVDGGGSMKMNGQAGMARAGGSPSSGQSFSALTDQIVKQTGILLRNNNSGEIRLVLKPEHLGNLRIKLDLNNNSLSGKIFVQNHEALKLVQQNLDTLYRALRDSGFTATELNVSVGGRDNGEKSKERSSPLPSMRAVGAVKGFDSQAPALETAGSYYSLVNLVI